MLSGFIALVISGLLIAFLINLSKKTKTKQKAENELNSAKKEYGWRLDKLKELVSLAKMLAGNGNQDARIIIQGVNECYLNNNLEHDPVSIVGYQTFIGQYDKFVSQYKSSVNNIGSIIKSVSEANKVLRTIPKIDCKSIVAQYDNIIFFEKPKYDLQKTLDDLLKAHTEECDKLTTETKQPNPDPIKINTYIGLVTSTLQALQNQIKSAKANVEFNDAQITTAKSAPKKLKAIQSDLIAAVKLQGVSTDAINKANELNSNINIAQNVDLSNDLVSALQVLTNVQNASLPIIKMCNDDYRTWKQSNTRQVPPRPGTNSRVAASARHSDLRGETKAQTLLREEQIRKQRYGNNVNVSSRTVVNSNTNNYIQDDYIDNSFNQPSLLDDVVTGIVAAEIIEDVIQPLQQDYIQYGGGQTDGAGAGGNWNQPEPEQTYTPEPEQQSSYEPDPEPQSSDYEDN